MYNQMIYEFNICLVTVYPHRIICFRLLPFLPLWASVAGICSVFPTGRSFLHRAVQPSPSPRVMSTSFALRIRKMWSGFQRKRFFPFLCFGVCANVDLAMGGRTNGHIPCWTERRLDVRSRNLLASMDELDFLFQTVRFHFANFSLMWILRR